MRRSAPLFNSQPVLFCPGVGAPHVWTPMAPFRSSRSGEALKDCRRTGGAQTTAVHDREIPCEYYTFLVLMENIFCCPDLECGPDLLPASEKRALDEGESLFVGKLLVK